MLPKQTRMRMDSGKAIDRKFSRDSALIIRNRTSPPKKLPRTVTVITTEAQIPATRLEMNASLLEECSRKVKEATTTKWSRKLIAKDKSRHWVEGLVMGTRASFFKIADDVDCETVEWADSFEEQISPSSLFRSRSSDPSRVDNLEYSTEMAA